MLYPYIHGAVIDAALADTAISFCEQMESIAQTQPSVPDESTPSTPAPLYADLRIAMEHYNIDIWEKQQTGLSGPQAYTAPSFTLGDYGLNSEVFGVIIIPKIDVYMPLYLGATREHLAAGAAHLSQTSLPIGGINTNCVISGHRGWKGASYFKYITNLQVGDKVIIRNLWETLEYTVCEKRIISPGNINSILIQDGRDLLTLLTCHPYASGGKQRYLVYCERSQ